MRPLLQTLALLVASFAVGLGGLEAAFRLASVSVGTVQINRRLVRRSENPRLMFELRPNATAHAEVDYRTNSHGMRSREIDERKPPGTIRIAVIGDSITFGYWVAEDDTFSRQLESQLNPPGSSPIEVLNFGVPGYNLDQETERLRSGLLRFSPDLVIVAVCLNDLRAFSNEYGLVLDRSKKRRTPLGHLTDTLLEHSVLLSWIEYRRARLDAARLLEEGGRPPKSGSQGRRVHGPADPMEQRKELSSRFSTIAEILRGAFVPGLVAVFPLFNSRFDDYPYRDVHRSVIETAREVGIPAVDLLECFEAYDYRQVRADEIHPNPMGHRVAAHAILEAVCAGGTFCEGRTRAPARGCTSYRPEEFRQVRGF
jgi:lysophospholipase L1-like esterase